MKYVLIGAGSRGMVYAEYAHEHGDEIVAIAEIRKERLANAASILETPAANCFTDTDDLFALGKVADACIIATMDRDHYGHVMKALDVGYDILLEKPISPDARECIEIEQKANALGLKITVCHVLRYTEFFMTLKEIIDSGELGKIVAIKHSENIGNWHMAHSFVRGNWANEADSSPIIMQKSCHDMDILLWLTGSHCTRVSAFGSLTYFKEENAPAGSTARCLDCPVAENCRFDARKNYLPVIGDWPSDVVCIEQTEEAVLKALKTSPYGRCVYRCGNDVCDHMSTIMEFENGVTATFSLTAQTTRIRREINIFLEDGEIYGDDDAGIITYTKFVSSEADTIHTNQIRIYGVDGGHNGGDPALMKDFTDNISGKATESRSSISRSVESHLMACAIEKARVTGEVVSLDKFREEIMK